MKILHMLYNINYQHEVKTEQIMNPLSALWCAQPGARSSRRTSLAGTLAGSLGVAPNIDPERRILSMFPPIHGSALDITGKGIANPMAMFWTTGQMMLAQERAGRQPAGTALAKRRTRGRVSARLSAETTPDRRGSRRPPVRRHARSTSSCRQGATDHPNCGSERSGKIRGTKTSALLRISESMLILHIERTTFNQ